MIFAIIGKFFDFFMEDVKEWTVWMPIVIFILFTVSILLEEVSTVTIIASVLVIMIGLIYPAVYYDWFGLWKKSLQYRIHIS